MRFFSGSRDLSQKKGAASQRYKQELDAKHTKAGGLAKEDPTAIYKKHMEARMAKMMEDVLLGKRSNATRLPGTKEPSETPKEISKTTMMMLRMLADRRAQKERKSLKKREVQFMRDKKTKEALERQAQAQADLLLKQKEEEYKASQQAMVDYWNKDPDKSSWW